MTVPPVEETKMEIDPALTASGKNETLSPSAPSQLLLRRTRSHGSNGTPTPISPSKEDDAVTPQQGLAARLHPPEPLPDMHKLHFRSPNPPTGAAAWSGDGGLSTTPGEMAASQSMQWQADEDARSYALEAQSAFPASQGLAAPEPTEDGQNGDWARRSWRSPGRTESTNSLKDAGEQAAPAPAAAQPYNPFAQVAVFGGGTGGSNGLMYTAQTASAANSPTARARAQHQQQAAIHRQSSKSSTRTASTSSEESDLCIPSIEWVNYERERQPFYAQKMPPPPEPRTPYLAVGASASTPLGIHQNQSLPPPASSNGGGGHSNIPDSALETEEDVDAATVGQGRESPSTSSQSAQSGLDLLWKAVAHHESVPPTPQPQPQAAPPSDRARGKRKAGQEVVAQWRSGGYGGSSTGSNNLTAVSALRGGSPSASGAEDGASSPAASGGPKKRRRSQLDPYDPALVASASPEEAPDSGDASDYTQSASEDDDDNSDYNGGSAKGRKAPARGAKRGAAAAARPKAAAPKRAKKAGGAKGRKASMGEGSETAGGSAQGVQCNYVFPRAPFPRCKDFFTRKYDLPRHMARHARREGELVYEGKLTEAEATLWKTIKDKPRVHCPTCGESFTRMDALKRHQTKQHHG